MYQIQKCELYLWLEKTWNLIKNYFNPKIIQILYFSKNVIIVCKDFDMKINSNNSTEVTVQTQLRKLYPWLANKKLYHEYYFPHRLDYATSGIMCIPTHKEACRVVSNIFITRSAQKYYIALLRGIVSEELIDVKMPVGEDIRYKNVQKMCTFDSNFCDKPKTARTLFLVLEEGIYDNYPATKVLIRLLTGRRHQIRTHCTFLGHTVVGDYTYSNRKDTKPFRMFLHSVRLVLPLSVEYIDAQTKDPFQNLPKWCLVKQVNQICNESYAKLEKCI